MSQRDELELPELPVFKNLDFRKAKLQDEIEALEQEIANDVASDAPSDAVNDAVKAAKSRRK